MLRSPLWLRCNRLKEEERSRLVFEGAGLIDHVQLIWVQGSMATSRRHMLPCGRACMGCAVLGDVAQHHITSAQSKLGSSAVASIHPGPGTIDYFSDSPLTRS